MKAVILAGGIGSRLRPLTYILPKAMLPVGDKPVLEHIIEYLKRNGISEIIVTTAYMGKMIEEYFNRGENLGVTIYYARAGKPLGTAGQLKTAEKYLKETFLAMNGDILVDVNIQDMLRFHNSHKAIGTISIKPYKLQVKYGIIDFDRKKRILEWREKPEINLAMNIGLYILEPDVLSYIPKGIPCSIEKEIFPKILKEKKKLFAYVSDTSYMDIGDLESLDKANEKLLSKLTGI